MAEPTPIENPCWQVRFKDGMQRGIFATRRIPKGGLCWDFSKKKRKMVPEEEARSQLETCSQTELIESLVRVFARLSLIFRC